MPQIVTFAFVVNQRVRVPRLGTVGRIRSMCFERGGNHWYRVEFDTDDCCLLRWYTEQQLERA